MEEKWQKSPPFTEAGVELECIFWCLCKEQVALDKGLLLRSWMAGCRDAKGESWSQAATVGGGGSGGEVAQAGQSWRLRKGPGHQPLLSLSWLLPLSQPSGPPC